MNHGQRQEILLQIAIIGEFLEAIQVQGLIGSWAFGTKRHEPPGYGFTLFCFVKDPQNKINYKVAEVNFLQDKPSMDIYDFVSFSDVAYALDKIAKAVNKLDLRTPPKTLQPIAQA